jgi:alpha-ketoglutarate-dependent sulfate ester dioxygenase
MSTLQRSQSVAIDLDVRPLAGCIGAQIDNIRLAGNLPDAVIAAIEGALSKYKVIFFSNQEPLDDPEQERFAARFGDLVAHPTSPARSGSAAILELDSTYGRGRADRWHTDVTFVDTYPKISLLRGVVIPAFGGDTVWANTVAAYEGLPAGLKTLAENLWAVHSNLYDYAAARPQASSVAVKHYEDVFTSAVYETEHPVVRVLPHNGGRSLVLGQFVRRFVGYSQSDSNHLFELFQSHVTKLENTVRRRWNAGDLAMWDNTATQHCAINDYDDQKRVVRRSTIRGEAPVSVDGRTGVTTWKTTTSTASAHSKQSIAA